MRDQIMPWLAAMASKAGATIAGVSAVGAFYVSVGGPVPATVSYVDALERRLTISSLEDRRAVNRLSRYFMGNEESAIAKTTAKLSESPNKTALERRRREIREQLDDITQDDDAARKRLAELKR